MHNLNVVGLDSFFHNPGVYLTGVLYCVFVVVVQYEDILNTTRGLRWEAFGPNNSLTLIYWSE